MSHALSVHATDHELEYRGFRFLARTATAGADATEPVVIVGGSSQDRFSWVRYERRLLPHTSVLTLELPGYADADPLPAEHGMDFLADAVRHAVETLSLGPVNVFGGCFGASISLRFAQDNPHLTSRLMLLGTAAGMSPEYVACAHRWRRMWEDGLRDELVEDMIERFMAPPEHGFVRRRSAVQRLMRHRWANRSERALAMDFTHRERLLTHPWCLPEPAVTAPVLVLTGEHDTLTPPSTGRQVARGLGARFTTVKEADHLVHLERDTDMADVMARYFTDQPLDGLPCLNAIEHTPPPGAPAPIPAAATAAGPTVPPPASAPPAPARHSV